MTGDDSEELLKTIVAANLDERTTQRKIRIYFVVLLYPSCHFEIIITVQYIATV